MCANDKFLWPRLTETWCERECITATDTIVQNPNRLKRWNSLPISLIGKFIIGRNEHTQISMILESWEVTSLGHLNEGLLWPSVNIQYYGGWEVQNKSRFCKQNNKLQTQMQI